MRTFLIALLTGLTILSCKEKDTQLEPSNFDFFETKWEVLKIQEDGGEWQTTSKSYVLNFYEISRYSTMLDINSAGGTWENPADGELLMTAGEQTLACCDSDFAQSMLKILNTVKTYELDGEVLTLNGDGKVELERQ